MSEISWLGPEKHMAGLLPTEPGTSPLPPSTWPGRVCEGPVVTRGCVCDWCVCEMRCWACDQYVCVMGVCVRV